jgi:PAS domain S-box-containing protein
MEPHPPNDALSRLARALLPYLAAVTAVSAGIVFRAFLLRFLGAELPYITLYPSIFVVAYFLGFGPTLLATAVAILAALDLFIGPHLAAGLQGPVAWIGSLLFGFTGVGVGWLGELRLRAERRAAEAIETTRAESARAEEETVRAEEEAARAEEETLRAEEEALRAEREAQRAAGESERLDRILGSIMDAFVVVNQRWIITYMNEPAAALDGGRPEDFVGRLLWEAFPETADGPFGGMYRRVMARRQVERMQGYVPRMDRWLLVAAYPWSDGLSIVAQDVSDRVRAHEACEKLAAIVASSEDAIIGKLLDGTVTSWNAAAERIFGYTAAEMVGVSIFRLVPPELHDLERQILQRVARGEPVERSETERIRSDGQRITIDLTVSPIRDAEGTVIGASSIKRDVTAQRRTQAALQAETARSRELAQAIDTAQAMVWDLDNRITYWSSGSARLYGWSAPEAVGHTTDELLRTELPASIEEIGRDLRDRGCWEGELIRVARDGRRLYVTAQWVLRRGERGEPLGVFEVGTDETARREAEERVRQSERLEVIGQLAGGVAHEANNQMTVILGAAEFLLRQPRLEGGARADVEQIRAAAERTAAITGQLLAFSRRQVLQPRVLDLDETVRGLEAVLRRALGERSTLTLGLRAGDARVVADPGQLAQVLLNLVLNARDAMPLGGHLRIETSLTELTERYAQQHPGITIRPGSYAMLAVSDTGHGMSRETAAHVFEPFFTTKPIGKGTGLGLATVYGIVKQSDGYIWPYSELGQGTTFKVYLPISPEPVPHLPAATKPMRTSGERLLLVEDEPAVRLMASRALQQYGYQVIEAGDGREALRLLEGSERPINLVVTDVVMPGMDGPELARRAQRLRPGLPVLFMSGYTDDEIVRRGLLEAGQPFLQKPYTPEALGEQVAELLKGH